MFLSFLWWHTDMFNERHFSQDDKILCQLMEKTISKQLNELCNTSCASAKLITSGFRGIWSHLNPKISCKGRQFNTPAKQSLIPRVGTTLQMKASKSTYVHFHGNVLHLHSALKITKDSYWKLLCNSNTSVMQRGCCISGHFLQRYFRQMMTFSSEPCAHQPYGFSDCDCSAFPKNQAPGGTLDWAFQS